MDPQCEGDKAEKEGKHNERGNGRTQEQFSSNSVGACFRINGGYYARHCKAQDVPKRKVEVAKHSWPEL
jgi:hypothetical protein